MDRDKYIDWLLDKKDNWRYKLSANVKSDEIDDGLKYLICEMRFKEWLDERADKKE